VVFQDQFEMVVDINLQNTLQNRSSSIGSTTLHNSANIFFLLK
jgi:hypothetical protein